MDYKEKNWRKGQAYFPRVTPMEQPWDVSLKPGQLLGDEDYVFSDATKDSVQLDFIRENNDKKIGLVGSKLSSLLRITTKD